MRKPEGRRLPAPPRRLPRPANDNSPPGRRGFIRAAMIATIIATAATLATFVAG